MLLFVVGVAVSSLVGVVVVRCSLCVVCCLVSFFPFGRWSLFVVCRSLFVV